jgi:hypothetical protein
MLGNLDNSELPTVICGGRDADLHSTRQGLLYSNQIDGVSDVDWQKFVIGTRTVVQLQPFNSRITQ